MRSALFVLLMLCGCDDDAPPADLAMPDLSVRDLTAAFACDPVTQDCPMATDKCTERESPMLGAVPVTVCVAAGTLTENQPCMTSGNNDAGHGFDDCAKGLICVVAQDGQQCLKFCDVSAQCTKARQFCSTNPGAVCATACTVQGTDCPGGLTCGTSVEELGAGTRQPVCRQVGATALGAACTSDTDCVADAFCAGTPKQCRATCSTTHGCTGAVCTPIPNTTGIAALGYCN